ncbi:MAG: co-chaperone GroES [Bacteroidales bacterium]
MKELQPLNQNVILDLSMEKKEEKTASGIIIPESAKEKPLHAPVVSIGNVENVEIKVGDVVFYKKFSGTELEFEGKKYLILPYADLLAKVVETEEI